MNNPSSPIAVFDSGVGGLSIYQELKKQLPNENFVYLADQKNAPYGSRSSKEIRSLTLRCLKFLLSPSSLSPKTYPLTPKLIVIACNTSTTSGIEEYRASFPQIPIVGVVPVVKTAAEKTKNKKIAILSTVRTASSKYQEELIKKFCPNYKIFNLIPPNSQNPPISPNSKLLFNIGCPSLVSLIEKGITDGKKIEKELSSILKPVIDAGCDTLVLGCTHYPFLEKTINKIIMGQTQGFVPTTIKSVGDDPCVVPPIQILDSSGAVARQTKHILEQNKLLNPQSPEFSFGEFLTTGNPQEFGKVIKKLIGL